MSFVQINSRDVTQVSLIRGNTIDPVPVSGPLPVGAFQDDVSGIFNVGSATFSALNLPGAGVSYITGNVTFKQNNQNFDFDDRFNTQWNRGNKILFKYTDPNPDVGQVVTETYYPVIGTTYITSSQYDMKSTLQLNIACILGLLNKLTPADLGICIDIGSGVSVSTAAQNLLEAAGIDPVLIDSTSFDNLLSIPELVEPLTVESGQSIIDAAANIVGRHGVFFCQDLNGIVKAKLWSNLDNKARLFSKRARDLHSYQRSGSLDARVKTLIATYNNSIVCTEDATQQQTNRSGDQLIVTDIERNEVNRTVTRTIREFRNIASVDVLVSKTLEVSLYEPIPAGADVVRVGQANANGECFPEDQGRLLTRTTETRIDNTEYLKTWNAAKTTAGQAGESGYPSVFSPLAGLVDPDGDFSVSGYNVSQTVTETWAYNSDTEYVFTREEFAPIAIAVPIWGNLAPSLPGTDPRLGSNPVPSEQDPNNLIRNRLVRDVYTKSDDACKGWKFTRETFESHYFNDPNEALTQIADQTKVIQDVYDESLTLILTALETENNVAEPSPDTYPPLNNIGLQEIELVFGDSPDQPLSLQAFPLDTQVRQFLGSYSNFAASQIQEIGQQTMDFNNGRVLAMVMADSPFQMVLECWDDFVPLFKTKIIEPYRDVASIFTADTPSITITPTETVVGWLGVLLGEQTDPAIIQNLSDFSFTKTANQPGSDLNEQNLPSIAIEGNYSVNTEVV